MSDDVAPYFYKGVKVPEDLKRFSWAGVEAYWWRRGVDIALVTAQQVIDCY